MWGKLSNKFVCLKKEANLEESVTDFNFVEIKYFKTFIKILKSPPKKMDVKKTKTNVTST